MNMGKNKLDAINFCELFHMFGEQAARDTLDDVNSGSVKESTIKKYLYTGETKEKYVDILKKEYEEFV